MELQLDKADDDLKYYTHTQEDQFAHRKHGTNAEAVEEEKKRVVEETK